jgi:hypothetical protein
LEIKISNAIIMGWLRTYVLSYFLPSLMSVASDHVITHGGNSTMILSLGMGRMGLCLVCPGRRNPRKREGVLVKVCKSRGRWAIWIKVVGLGLNK